MSLAPSEMKSSGNSSFWFVQFSIVTPTAFWTQIVRIFSLETLWRGPAYQMAWRYAEWQDGISFKDILFIILQLLSPTPCRQSENCLSWYFLASFGFGCLRKSKQQKNNTRALEQSPKRGQTRIDAWHPSLQCTQFHLKLLVEWTSSSSSSKSNQLLQNINGSCYIFFFGQILAKNEMEKIHYIRMIEHTFPFQIIWSGCLTHTTSKSVGESDY